MIYIWMIMCTPFGYKPNPYVYIKCADLFVSCSLAEGFSLVVAEALCLGKEAIVSTKTVEFSRAFRVKFRVWGFGRQ